MPIFPKLLSVVRASTVSVLHSLHQSGYLFSAYNTVHTLKYVADVNGSVDAAGKVNTLMIVCTYAKRIAVVKFVLVYDKHVYHHNNRHALYVSKTVKPGCEGGKVVVFGQFNSMEGARRADTVQ